MQINCWKSIGTEVDVMGRTCMETRLGPNDVALSASMQQHFSEVDTDWIIRGDTKSRASFTKLGHKVDNGVRLEVITCLDSLRPSFLVRGTNMQ